MTAHTQQLVPETRVAGNYLGLAEYTGAIGTTWPSIEYPDGHTSVWITLDRPITLFGIDNDGICVVVDSDSEPVDGRTTLSVVA